MPTVSIELALLLLLVFALGGVAGLALRTVLRERVGQRTAAMVLRRRSRPVDATLPAKAEAMSASQHSLVPEQQHAPNVVTPIAATENTAGAQGAEMLADADPPALPSREEAQSAAVADNEHLARLQIDAVAQAFAPPEGELSPIVVEAIPTPTPAASAAPVPEQGAPTTSALPWPDFPAPQGEARDDLKRIKGIGPRMEARLQSLGLVQYGQIARLTPQQVRWLDAELAARNRIAREAWVAQAQRLAGGAQSDALGL